MNQLESRINSIELRVSANADFDSIVTAWQAGQTYSNLPWLIQITLLCREVFSSSILNYELQDYGSDYRDLLANKILTTVKDASEPISIARLINRTCKDIAKEDLAIVSSLLETRSMGYARLMNMPHLFTLSTALEMSSLDEEAKPKQSGRLALAICNAQITSLSRTKDAYSLVNEIVHEAANDCLSIMA